MRSCPLLFTSIVPFYSYYKHIKEKRVFACNPNRMTGESGEKSLKASSSCSQALGLLGEKDDAGPSLTCSSEVSLLAGGVNNLLFSRSSSQECLWRKRKPDRQRDFARIRPAQQYSLLSMMRPLVQQHWPALLTAIH